MQILDLFSGSKSWTAPFKYNGHEVISLDIDSQFDPDIRIDILEWNYRKSGLHPDVIFASPPCTYFSVARRGYGSMEKNYPRDKVAWSIRLFAKTFEIINYFKPKHYVVENPLGYAKKWYPFGFERIDYCAYGYQVRGQWVKKPTLLWTNVPIQFRTCPRDHKHVNMKSCISGVTVGFTVSKRVVGRSKIPEGLAEEIKEVIE